MLWLHNMGHVKWPPCPRKKINKKKSKYVKQYSTKPFGVSFRFQNWCVFVSGGNHMQSFSFSHYCLLFPVGYSHDHMNFVPPWGNFFVANVNPEVLSPINHIINSWGIFGCFCDERVGMWLKLKTVKQFGKILEHPYIKIIKKKKKNLCSNATIWDEGLERICDWP